VGAGRAGYRGVCGLLRADASAYGQRKDLRSFNAEGRGVAGSTEGKLRLFFDSGTRFSR